MGAGLVRRVEPDLNLKGLTLGLCRRRGIEARRKFVAPVGAWFSQIGRLHQVYHMWQYPSVELSLLPCLDLTVPVQRPAHAEGDS